MHITSYDWLDGQRGGQGGRGGGAPRPARTVLDASLSAADAPAVLFPAAGGNIHEFTALTDCAVLDLMSPPYSTGARCRAAGAPPGPLAACWRWLLTGLQECRLAACLHACWRRLLAGRSLAGRSAACCRGRCWAACTLRSWLRAGPRCVLGRA